MNFKEMISCTSKDFLFLKNEKREFKGFRLLLIILYKT